MGTQRDFEELLAFCEPLTFASKARKRKKIEKENRRPNAFHPRSNLKYQKPRLRPLRKRQKDFNSQRPWLAKRNSVIWIQQVSCTYELTAVEAGCTRPAQTQCRQHSSPDQGSWQSLTPREGTISIHSFWARRSTFSFRAKPWWVDCPLVKAVYSEVNGQRKSYLKKNQKLEGHKVGWCGK